MKIGDIYRKGEKLVLVVDKANHWVTYTEDHITTQIGRSIFEAEYGRVGSWVECVERLMRSECLEGSKLPDADYLDCGKCIVCKMQNNGDDYSGE